MSLKDTWKQTGTGLGHAFRDLGKAVVKTVKTGADKADEWANGDDKPEENKNPQAEPEKKDKKAE